MRRTEVKETVYRKYKIQAKPTEYILCPANAIEDEFYHRNPLDLPLLVTSDGNPHKCTFICSWNNGGGIYEKELEDICQKYYGIPFVSIRSMWIGRLGTLSDYWHLIKLD